MSGYDYATWRICCTYANSGIRLTATEYANRKNGDDVRTGRVVDFNLDLSHTHSLSGSTGEDGNHRHVFSADYNANHTNFPPAGEYNTLSGEGKGGGYGAYTTYSGSHTHSVSGSTGGMSDPDYAKINFQLDAEVIVWDFTRTSWYSGNSTDYDAVSSKDTTGQAAYCTIDLSHTHSLSKVKIYLIKIYILITLIFLLDSL